MKIAPERQEVMYEDIKQILEGHINRKNDIDDHMPKEPGMHDTKGWHKEALDTLVASELFTEEELQKIANVLLDESSELAKIRRDDALYGQGSHDSLKLRAMKQSMRTHKSKTDSSEIGIKARIKNKVPYTGPKIDDERGNVGRRGLANHNSGHTK